MNTSVNEAPRKMVHIAGMYHGKIVYAPNQATDNTPITKHGPPALRHKADLLAADVHAILGQAHDIGVDIARI